MRWKELTGRESEPWEIIYFKLYKTQILVIEQAIETAELMLGTDKSRGYCLEMICADFLAGANLDNEDPTALLQSMSWFFEFLPGNQRQAFLHDVTQCQVCGSRQNVQVHHKQLRSQQGPNNDSNLITLCVRCHEIQHRLR